MFWDITPYSPLKFNRRFEGTHTSLNFKGQKYTRIETSVKPVANRTLILSRVWGSMTNNCGLWIRRSCLLDNSFTITATLNLKSRLADDAI
jgi:hypothetical protein